MKVNKRYQGHTNDLFRTGLSPNLLSSLKWFCSKVNASKLNTTQIGETDVLDDIFA